MQSRTQIQGQNQSREQKHVQSRDWKRLHSRSILHQRQLVSGELEQELDHPEEQNNDLDPDCFEDHFDDGKDSLYFEVFNESSDNSPSLVLDFDNLHQISILKDNSNTDYCYYDPPDWMVNNVIKEYRGQMKYTIDFIYSLVNYFNNEQQKFLNNPTPTNFHFDGKLEREPFLKAVSKYGIKLDKTNFSVLQKDIWFIWPDKSFCLYSIFK
ncbi:hypothetical protein HOE22_09590, partial [Candidatus Woesearchaeota archaeon]|jgi:hypothetical protein|nr:hypothetical protein [Bacteroidota bacterium]MBT4208580.1 hypothetical protein [Candidatus Woesearchaeota archaeon]